MNKLILSDGIVYEKVDADNAYYRVLDLETMYVTAMTGQDIIYAYNKDKNYFNNFGIVYGEYHIACKNLNFDSSFCSLLSTIQNRIGIVVSEKEIVIYFFDTCQKTTIEFNTEDIFKIVINDVCIMSMDVSDLGEKIKCSFRRNSYYNVYIQYAYFLTNTLFKVKLHFDASEFRNLLDFNEHIYIDITTGKVVRTAVIYDDALSNDDIGQYFKYSDYYFLDIENS